MKNDINKAHTINEVQEQDIQINSKFKSYFYCFIICLSTVYSGYSLTLISSTSSTQLRSYYNITASPQTTASLLNGILPIGAMLGCLLLPYFLKITNKKLSHYYMFFATLVCCGLSVIPSFQSIIIGRFLLGILNAFYTSIASGYIKETFPYHLRKSFGAIYSCGRIVGILLCYLIADIFHYPEDQIQHILVFCGPIFLALIQLVLIYLYLPHSPIDMINKKDDQQLYSNLSKIYSWENTIIIANLLKNQAQKSQITANNHVNKNLTKRKDYLSYHLAFLRQFCGATFIVIYARQVMLDLKSQLANDTPLIINSVQLLSGLAGVILVNLFQRRFMVIFSTFALALITLAIGISDVYQKSKLCLIFMTLFMIPCGSCLTSIIWSYPSQLASKINGKYASFISWGGAAIMTLVPPYILKAMPNNSAYPIFFFFSFYLSISFIANYFVLMEVSDLKSEMIELKDKSLLS